MLAKKSQGYSIENKVKKSLAKLGYMGTLMHFWEWSRNNVDGWENERKENDVHFLPFTD